MCPDEDARRYPARVVSPNERGVRGGQNETARVKRSALMRRNGEVENHSVVGDKISSALELLRVEPKDCLGRPRSKYPAPLSRNHQDDAGGNGGLRWGYSNT